jgi:hypothetical protein
MNREETMSGGQAAMQGGGRVMGMVRVRVINERGYVMEEKMFSGMVTDEEAFVRDREGEASTWHVLVGTKDRIRYRGNTAPGKVQNLDAGYPEAEEDGGKRKMVYQATFAADSLNAREVNAAVLVRRTPKAAQGVAYARIDPEMRIETGAILRIQWECRAHEGE